MSMQRGTKLLEEHAGEGQVAKKGDRVVYNVRIHLNRGDEVAMNEQQAQSVPAEMLRDVDGRTLVDHTTTLGRRQSIAAVDYALIGMNEGGYRKVRASPHLAYGTKGVPGLIPANAVLLLEIWLRSVEPTS